MTRKASAAFLGLGAALLALGLVSGLMDAVILGWEAKSAGHPDIAARAPWIAAMFAPIFVGVSAVAAVLLMYFAKAIRKVGLVPALAAASIGTIAGVGFLWLLPVQVYVHLGRLPELLVLLLYIVFAGAGAGAIIWFGQRGIVRDAPQHGV